MNKKQLIVMSILLSLMLLLAITQKLFKDNFEQVIFMNQGISEFKEYNFDDSRYIISLPNEWIVDQKESKGQYISCKLNFKDENNKINGLVEVINTKVDLNVFAENDLNNQYLNYYNSEIIPFKNSNNSGVLAQYETTIKDGYDFKNECYYLNLEEGKTVKILFNINEKSYRQNMKTILNAITSSIKKV